MDVFVLNDETQYNTYGFRIPNAGLRLERFKINPVMLDDHYNSTNSVIGKWKNIRIQGNQLMAEPEFDIEDENAKTIKGKVDRGFIKGVSIGIIFDREKMKIGADGKLFLSEAEVLEASIVAIPSNAGALRLYAPQTHELMSEEDVKLCLSALTEKNTLNKETNMEKLILTAVALSALGLDTGADAQKISEAIGQLDRKYQAEKTAREALQAKLDKQQETQANDLVDKAISDGKLTAETKNDFLEIAKNNYELAVKILAGIPAKKSLSGSISNPNKGGEVKSLDDFLKLSLEEQLAFKEHNPEAYKALLK